MVSLIRKHLSTKIYDVLKQSSLLAATSTCEDVISKLDYFTRVATVTKASKVFGSFTVNFNDLHDYGVVNAKKLSDEIKSKLERVLPDSLVKSSKFVNDTTLLIDTDVEEFSKSTVSTILAENESYGYCLPAESHFPRRLNAEIKWAPKQSKTRTIVEFSSPNIAKPLHAGHMRSTFLGTFISNVHEKLGHKVTRVNYLGDWGTQYGILAVGFKKHGSMEKLNSAPMRHLLDVYVAANKDESMYQDALSYFAKMEAGDEEAIKLWTLFKELSIKELIETYKKLNITFDSYEAESEYFRKSKDVVKTLVEKGICKKLGNNALEVKFDGTDKKPVKFIVQKGDGTTLYISRDIAALLERKSKYNFGKIVYVVDSAQTDHFRNLYHTVKRLDASCLGDLQFEQFYVPFGRFTNMSTRSGKVELLSDLITEAKDVALDYMNNSRIQKHVEDRELTAQIIGASHLIINDFIRPRIKDYKFSWENLLANDDSGYMIQYAHARLHSLLERCKSELSIDISKTDDLNFKLLTQPIELILIQHLAKYDEIIWKSFVEYEPYVLVQYLFQLVRFVNLSINENYVTGQAADVAKVRFTLYHCCKQVLSNSLKVLSITPLNRI